MLNCSLHFNHDLLNLIKKFFRNNLQLITIGSIDEIRRERRDHYNVFIINVTMRGK